MRGEQCRRHGVTYYRSEKPKSEIYLSFLHVVNSRQVRLLALAAANACAEAVVLCALETL